jgi:hypothetical protein
MDKEAFRKGPMRPEIEESVIDRLDRWVYERKIREFRRGPSGQKMNYWYPYSVSDAISDLLREAGY